MAVKKHKLDMAIDEDYCLLGIVADEPDYKLCWLINRTLSTNFVRLDDLMLYNRKHKTDQQFSIFAFTDEDSLLTYRIIKNRGDAGYFLDGLKNLDYLVHIQGEVYPEKISTFLQGTASIQEIRMCVPVDLAKIRNQERLLLW
jgi:hypothetical protein